MKKGVSLVTVPVAAIAGISEPQHSLVEKYAPFFQEIEKDSVKSKGINIWHIPNPETNNNDITMIQFDMRMFQREMLEASQPTPAFTAMMNQNPPQPISNPPNTPAPLSVSNQQPQTVVPTPPNEEVIQ